MYQPYPFMPARRPAKRRLVPPKSPGCEPRPINRAVFSRKNETLRFPVERGETALRVTSCKTIYLRLISMAEILHKELSYAVVEASSLQTKRIVR